MPSQVLLPCDEILLFWSNYPNLSSSVFDKGQARSPGPHLRSDTFRLRELCCPSKWHIKLSALLDSCHPRRGESCFKVTFLPHEVGISLQFVGCAAASANSVVLIAFQWRKWPLMEWRDCGIRRRRRQHNRVCPKGRALKGCMMPSPFARLRTQVLCDHLHMIFCSKEWKFKKHPSVPK